ncbi:hypothetical protein V6N13_076746 [Hibiscus sabdariffa]
MELGGRQTITLFVQNLPTTIHWRGLWQVFGRHGDVVDSFIASKLDRAGRRFGFVRFSNRLDANRAIERLDGFRLYGSRISVSVAKYNGRSLFWRKARQGKDYHVMKNGSFNGKQTLNEEPEKQKASMVSVEGSSKGGSDAVGLFSQSGKCSKRIPGYVEEETLWKLRNCLIGTMAMICSTRLVEERLHKWGLGELVVKKMGSRRFLIEFKDRELFKLLEGHHWALLKEVFSDIEPWSKSFHLPETITWVQKVTGILLHCWNYTTFKRLVESWGSLVALGENANQFFDCPTTQDSSKQFVENMENPSRKLDSEIRELSSESSSESVRSKTPVSMERSKCLDEDEAVIAICMGNLPYDGAVMNEYEETGHVGEADLTGCTMMT